MNKYTDNNTFDIFHLSKLSMLDPDEYINDENKALSIVKDLKELINFAENLLSVEHKNSENFASSFETFLANDYIYEHDNSEIDIYTISVPRIL